MPIIIISITYFICYYYVYDNISECTILIKIFWNYNNLYINVYDDDLIFVMADYYIFVVFLI
jgi:hypothetical protein